MPIEHVDAIPCPVPNALGGGVLGWQQDLIKSTENGCTEFTLIIFLILCQVPARSSFPPLSVHCSILFYFVVFFIVFIISLLRFASSVLVLYPQYTTQPIQSPPRHFPCYLTVSTTFHSSLQHQDHRSLSAPFIRVSRTAGQSAHPHRSISQELKPITKCVSALIMASIAFR